MKTIPYGRQCIDKSDIDEVIAVLKSDWITQGPKIKEFEEALAKYCGCKYAVAVSSGTAALHLACVVAGLRKSDEAITTPITFLATSNSILYTGAKVVFADINHDTANIDPQEIRKRITRMTKVILPVHLGGLPCDMEQIYKVAKKNGLVVIEDACHALGAGYRFNGRWVKVGSCRHSDMAVFSFHPIKSITTGEGGAVTTNNKNIYNRLLALRSHGIHKNHSLITRHGLWYYEMRELGFNYRITDFQSALGIAQLKKLGFFLKRRQEIAGIYNDRFKDLNNLKLPYNNHSKKHAYHLYALRINFERLKTSRQEFMHRLRQHHIITQVHYIPIYRQPYYKKNYQVRFSNFPKSEDYYKEALSIPIYPEMDDADVNRVANIIKMLVTKITKR